MSSIFRETRDIFNGFVYAISTQLTYTQNLGINTSYSSLPPHYQTLAPTCSSLNTHTYICSHT
ncbi:hypothetical protein HanPI659440_Chr15g0598161 [Helianthus annuus]|nr:hypothetical protein HanPI659440_Chr15g0598161 [Helianthus annuus]